MRKAVAYVRFQNDEFNAEKFAEIEDYCEYFSVELNAYLYDYHSETHKDFNDRPGGSRLTEICQDTGARNIIVPKLWHPFKDAVDAGRRIKSWRSKRIKLHIVNLQGFPFVNEGLEGRGFNKAVLEMADIARFNF